MTDHLTTAQVAAAVGVKPRAVQKQCAAGRLPGAVLVQTQRGPVWMVPAILTTCAWPRMTGLTRYSEAVGKPGRQAKA